ncbi:MAG: hypothetical protein IJD30_00445, partial [Clostridia bacterium]|nr:hypothetical protein [Clostridia bacterium]
CILSDAGYKTGKYTSPNMLKVNERINIDGVDISDIDLENTLSDVSDAAKKLDKMPTQFEIWTAAAFCYFKERNCDFVVLETGLGGEHDATNVIKNPVITVITRIAVDHTEYLGNTISDIARAKAGIIKPSIYGGCTVTLNQPTDVDKILKDTALKYSNEYIVTKPHNLHPFISDFEVFDYDGLSNIKMQLLGAHQAENASLAIECARKLKIDNKYILSGIERAKNIGRFDLISKNPDILFDGAHNKNGMSALSENLLRCFPDRKINYIMGFMKDKDIDGAISQLKNNGNNSVVYTVTVKDNPRAISSVELSKKLAQHGFDVISCTSVREALEQSIKTDALTVICGSLYLYKDLFEEFN